MQIFLSVRNIPISWRFCAQATLADSFLADLEDLSDDENHDEVCF